MTQQRVVSLPYFNYLDGTCEWIKALASFYKKNSVEGSGVGVRHVVELTNMMNVTHEIWRFG